MLCIGLYPLANHLAHNKVVALLKDESNNFPIKSYEDLKINVWKGKLHISNVEFEAPAENKLTRSNIKSKSIHIDGLKLVKLWIHKDIKINRIEILNSEVQLVIGKPITEDSQDGAKSFKKPPKINVREVSIKNMVFAKRDENDNLLTKFKLVDATLKNLKIEDWETPSTWYNNLVSYNIEIEELYHKTTVTEVMEMDEILLTDKNHQFKNLHFYTPLPKEDSQLSIVEEKSHFNIEVSAIEISPIRWDTHEGKQQFYISTIGVTSPNVSVYDNGLLTENTNTKPSTSQLFNDLKIEIGRLEVLEPEVHLVFKETTTEKEKPNSIKEFPELSIAVVAIKDVSFYKHNEKDELQTKFKLVDATLKNLIIEDWETPSTWYSNLDSYTIEVENLYHKATDWEAFKLDKIALTETAYKIQNLRFYTELNEKEYNAKLPHERDHYNVEIPTIETSSVQWATHEGRQQFFISKIDFNAPKINLFRDKLLPDDTSIKPLFSQLLRELKFDIQTEKIILSKADITYTERVQEENSGGSVYFSEFNAVISDAGNFKEVNEKKDIKIEVETTFMKNAKLTADWRFNPQKTEDSFHFQAKISRLDANRSNVFTEPNLFVKMNGSIDLLFLNIHGNRNSSDTDFAISYHDLKVELLNKKGRDKLKVISAIANIFVRKNSETTEGKLQEARVKVERDQTKSIFNFLWKNTLEGLKKSIVNI